eukprot:g2158.t1
MNESSPPGKDSTDAQSKRKISIVDIDLIENGKWARRSVEEASLSILEGDYQFEEFKASQNPILEEEEEHGDIPLALQKRIQTNKALQDAKVRIQNFVSEFEKAQKNFIIELETLDPKLRDNYNEQRRENLARQSMSIQVKDIDEETFAIREQRRSLMNLIREQKDRSQNLRGQLTKLEHWCNSAIDRKDNLVGDLIPSNASAGSPSSARRSMGENRMSMASVVHSPKPSKDLMNLIKTNTDHLTERHNSLLTKMKSLAQGEIMTERKKHTVTSDALKATQKLLEESLEKENKLAVANRRLKADLSSLRSVNIDIEKELKQHRKINANVQRSKKAEKNLLKLEKESAKKQEQQQQLLKSKDGEINGLKKVVTNLREQVSKLESSKQMLEKDAQQLEAELAKKVNEHRNEAQQLRRRITTLKSDVTYKEQVGSKERSVLQAKDDIDREEALKDLHKSHEMRIKELEIAHKNEIEKLRSENQKLVKEGANVSVSRLQRLDVSKLADQYAAQVKELEEEYEEKLKKKIQDMQSKEASMEKALRSKIEKETRLQLMQLETSKLNTAEEYRFEMEEKLKNAEDVVSAAQESVKGLTDRMAIEKRNFEKIIEDLQSKCTNLENELVTSNDQLKSFFAMGFSSPLELKNMKGKEQQHQEEIERLTQSFEGDIEVLTKKLELGADEIQRLRTSEADMKAEIGTLKKHIATKDETILELRETNEKFDSSLMSNNFGGRKASGVSHQSSQVIRGLQARVRALTSELQNSQRKLKKKVDQYRDTEKRLQEMTKRIASGQVREGQSSKGVDKKKTRVSLNSAGPESYMRKLVESQKQNALLKAKLEQERSLFRQNHTITKRKHAKEVKKFKAVIFQYAKQLSKKNGLENQKIGMNHESLAVGKPFGKPVVPSSSSELQPNRDFNYNIPKSKEQEPWTLSMPHSHGIEMSAVPHAKNGSNSTKRPIPDFLQGQSWTTRPRTVPNRLRKQQRFRKTKKMPVQSYDFREKAELDSSRGEFPDHSSTKTANNILFKKPSPENIRRPRTAQNLFASGTGFSIGSWEQS